MTIKISTQIFGLIALLTIATSILLSLGAARSINIINIQLEELQWENEQLENMFKKVMWEMESDKNRDTQLNDILKGTTELLNYNIERGFVVEEISSYYTGVYNDYINLINKFFDAVRRVDYGD